MGLHDREYVRGRQPGLFLGGDRTAVTDLIIVNVGVFLLDLFLTGGTPADLEPSRLTAWFGLHADVLNHPWLAYELVTYGFVHDLRSMMHIFFNMFALWVFGRDIEAIYGRNEFLRVYLAMVVFGGAVWLAIRFVTVPPMSRPDVPPVIGASGAVVGVMVLYAMHFPHRILLVMGVIPAPAWAVCVFCILLDVFGFGGGVAHDVHLAGATFAFLYHKSGWNLGHTFGNGKWRQKLRSLGGPRLHVHKPQNEAPLEPEHHGSDTEQVDRILAKISERGESSLTREERRILEDASRRYQQRRR